MPSSLRNNTELRFPKSGVRRPAMAKRNKRKQSSTTSTSSWSDLPESLLYKILTLLPSIRDLVSFSSVCRSWRSSSSTSPSLLPPLLLYPVTEPTRRLAPPRVSSLRLHDPANLSARYPLSHASRNFLSQIFLSYSHGHLLFISYNRILVINPLTNYQLISPHITTEYLNESIGLLTAPPSSSNSSILLFTSGRFFKWQIGSREWCSFQWPLTDGGPETHKKVRLINLKSKIYVDSYVGLYVSDLGPRLSLRGVEAESLFTKLTFSMIDWFVDFGGDLLFLQFEAGEEMLGARANAFRLVNSSWVKMENLGDYAVFVGPNSNIPGLACENPERWGGRKNCIYFARSNDDGNGAWAEIELGEEIDISDPESPLSGRRRNSEWLKPLWLYPSMLI